MDSPFFCGFGLRATYRLLKSISRDVTKETFKSELIESTKLGTLTAQQMFRWKSVASMPNKMVPFIKHLPKSLYVARRGRDGTGKEEMRSGRIIGSNQHETLQLAFCWEMHTRMLCAVSTYLRARFCQQTVEEGIQLCLSYVTFF